MEVQLKINLHVCLVYLRAHLIIQWPGAMEIDAIAYEE